MSGSGAPGAKPGPGSLTSIRRARSLASTDRRDRVAVVQAGVADRVRHQLGDEQLGVLQAPRRQVVGEVAERPPRRGRRVGVLGELEPVPHAGRLRRVDEREPLAHPRHVEHAHHRLRPRDEGEAAAGALGLERRHDDRAQAGRVHELDPAEIEHDRALRRAGELLLERGGAGEVELAGERDDGRRSGP